MTFRKQQIRNKNDKRHKHSMCRTDPISKMKQEEKEFHKEVMSSIYIETFLYIYET